MIVACSSTPSIPSEVTVQAALPTPTPEPTFTPSPPPSDTPIATPTATPTPEPTPTPLPQASLSGRILDQEANQPIVDAQVSVDDQTTTTDDKGRYILTDLPPGQYILSVTHPDYDPGLSSIFTLAAGQEQSLDLALYAPDTSPYPKDPMLTNPLDPNGAPTAEDAERLARLQGLTGDVVNLREVKLSGEYLVNYKIGEEVRAAVAELNHDVWELTDEAGRAWWIIQVCGNLVSSLPAEVAVATPQPRPLPPMAEVVTDGLIVRECASEACAEVGAVQQGTQVEVLGCLADGSWCQVGLPDGGSGWCAGGSLRQLAVAEAVLAVQAVLPTATPGVAAGEGKIAFLSTRDHLSEEYPHYELYLMNSDGSQQERITTGLSKYPYAGTLSWMPGHNQLFFETIGPSWKVINLSDGIPIPWQPPSVSGIPDFLDLSPDGSKLAYTDAQPPSFDIFTINIDGTDHRQLTATEEEVQANHPSWSPEGDKLAFTVLESGNSLWVMNADGSTKVKLTDNVGAREPTWSPDGKRIAFECWIFGVSDPGAGDICVINSDGTNLVNITRFQNQWASHLTWSPDGTRIAFYDPSTSGLQVYIINADGTGLTQLTLEGNNCCPAWSR
jgi:protocatechuate 3,4-dioxygenase beta subunit